MTDDRFHRAVYVISVAAELAGVHPQTLRIYERRGLLAPARTAGGSRRYSDADLALLARIAELTDEGLNLAGVQRVLELEQTVAELQDQLALARSARGERDEAAPGAAQLVPQSPAVTASRAVTLYRGRGRRSEAQAHKTDGRRRGQE